MIKLHLNGYFKSIIDSQLPITTFLCLNINEIKSSFSLIVQCSLGQNNCGKLGDNLNLLCHKQGTNVILIDFSHLFVLLRDGTLKKSQWNEIRKPNEELLPSFSFHPVTI